MKESAIVKSAWAGPAALVAASMLTASLAGATGSEIFVTTETITSQLQKPTNLVAAPGDAQRLFVTDLVGQIRIIKNGQLLDEPFLDITAIVNSTPPERGLVGLAFHPDYQTNGLFYVTYANLDSTSVLARFTVTADPEVADPASHVTLLTVDQPEPSHNVGWIGFGPDGYLYVGSGDGGNATGGVNAQSTDLLLGKILRIDVDTDDFPKDPQRNYGIPATNPFVGGPERDEIWASGLRNPWRCSFDPVTSDLWIADVGQGTREELDFQPAASTGGENYGWNCMEGTVCHEPATGCTCGAPELVAPVHEYDHTQGGCAIIGGFVYRGTAIAGLTGQYVFTDLCEGKVWAYEPAGGKITVILDGQPGAFSMGEDATGELYLLSPIDIRKIVINDCNDNQIPDEQDVADGTSDDCNGDLVPDECEPDCNDNLIADECDITSGTSNDVNSNGVPDECDTSADLDGDGSVGINDFLILLGSWGPCPQPCPPTCLGDVDADCNVGINDFLILLGSWS